MTFARPNLLPDSGSDFETRTHALEPSANTGTALAAGGALQGSYSVRLYAIAAGTISATTPRVFVTPGTEYVARFPYRLSTASAGKAAQSVITWFGSDGVVGTTSSATMTVPSTTGWAGEDAHPTAVGRAPEGAISAALTLNFTNAALNESIHVDRVYLAPVDTLSGNLLGYNTSSFEDTVTGWTVTGGTGSRVALDLRGGAGYSGLQANASGAGTLTTRMNTSVPVAEGSEYVAYALTYADGSYSGAFELEWLDGTGTLLSTTTATHGFAAAVARAVVVGTAPAGAVSARPVARATVTAANQKIYLDDVALRAAPNEPGSLLTYDEYSTESTLPAWTLTGGTGLTRASLTSGFTDGFYGLRYTPSTAAEHDLSLDRLIPVTAGTVYGVGAAIVGYNPTAGTTEVSARIIVDWYDSSGVLVQLGDPDEYYATPVGPVTSVGAFVRATRECPVGATRGRVRIQFDHRESVCSFYFVDNVFLKESVAEYSPVVSDERGVVTLTINYVPPKSELRDYITVRRMDADGSSHVVRGFDHDWLLAPNPYEPLVIEDYEAPMGSRIWYDIVWSNQDGSASSARIGTRTFDSPVLADGSYVWLKSPGVPTLNLRTVLESPPTWGRSARATVYPIVGRTNPVQITQNRAGRTGSLSVLALDYTTHQKINELLGTGLPVLVQAMPGHHLDGNLYVSVGDVDAEWLVPDARDDAWRWTLAATEIDRPVGGMEGSTGITWQTVLDNHGTWDDVLTTRETWSQVFLEG